jgi:hypothetical protein
MSERWISDLPGYKREGAAHPLDSYLTSKRVDYGEGASTYLSNAALFGGNLPVSSHQIEQLAASARERTIREQGAALYVSGLADRLIAACNSDRAIPAEPAERTALTDLFRDEYNIDLTPYVGQPPSPLGITGAMSRDGGAVVGLNYMTLHEPQSKTFWQLRIDGDYGFVNMYCVGLSRHEAPLNGSGNITNVPGVQEALTADVTWIEQQAGRNA